MPDEEDEAHAAESPRQERRQVIKILDQGARRGRNNPN